MDDTPSMDMAFGRVYFFQVCSRRASEVSSWDPNGTVLAVRDRLEKWAGPDLMDSREHDQLKHSTCKQAIRIVKAGVDLPYVQHARPTFLYTI